MEISDLSNSNLKIDVGNDIKNTKENLLLLFKNNKN